MWCSSRTRTCSSGPSSNRCARSGISVARSKPRAAAAESAAGSFAASTALTSIGPRLAPAPGSTDAAPRRAPGTRVRKLSCRSTRSPSACSQRRAVERAGAAAPPAGSDRRRSRPPAGAGTTAAAARRTAGFPPARGIATSGARNACSAEPRRAACAATVGASNRLRIDTSTESVARIRLISRVANSEWPPSSKKLSSMPTRWQAQHLGKQRAQDRLLAGCAGARYECSGVALRLRQRATVELAVRGERQTLQRPPAPTAPCSREAAGRAPPATPPDRRRRLPPRPHSRSAACCPRRRRAAITAACATLASRMSAASISPGSMRKPRSFTCASARPKNSSTPSARHRARSPVRYIRLPGAAVRVGDEPLRRESRRAAGSRAPDPGPAM